MNNVKRPVIEQYTDTLNGDTKAAEACYNVWMHGSQVEIARRGEGYAHLVSLVAGRVAKGDDAEAILAPIERVLMPGEASRESGYWSGLRQQLRNDVANGVRFILGTDAEETEEEQ